MNSRRVYFALGALTLFCLTLSNFSKEMPDKKYIEAVQNDTDGVALFPGELPGYTGWVRKARNLRGSFQALHVSHAGSVTAAGEEWNVTVRCSTCHGSNALFYARAYGPAVVAGDVRPVGHDMYEIGFKTMDPGSYYVEVVEVSSEAPSFEAFPVSGEEPLYEGYMVPGFPFNLRVMPPLTPQATRTCSFKELLSETQDSARHQARWVVTGRTGEQDSETATNASKVSLLEGYRSGLYSLGVFMEYRPRRCSLQPLQEGTRWLASLADARPVHLIFVGDSVMRMQHDHFQAIVPENVKTSLVSTSDGIVRKINNVTSSLSEILEKDPEERRFILFNTGLHDVAQLCSRKWRDVREESFGPDSNFSCSAQYRRSLGELVEFIRAYPAELKVFQSTTAAWSRWGNYGGEWPLNQLQDLAMSPNMVEHFNEIAYDVLSSAGNIPILDAYWMTLARPDNRQVALIKTLQRKLVHPGEEVLEAMVQLWMNVLVSSEDHVVSEEWQLAQ